MLVSDKCYVDMRHIISPDSILINKELGVGEFGVVQQGVWTNDDGERIQVAIKCLSCERFENNRIEFLKEATIMHSISHEHIVRLYGVVLEPSLMLVTELAPLRSLLECLKEPALRSQFPIISLCNFAAQIADGMCYLESKRLIHRDLAARNILVFAKNKVKISDFGLSRALGVGKDYYQTNFNVNLKLPIAWCAPECINYLKFTSQSDVWAYGVTLWEMFSYGFQPWAALTGQQILESIDKPSYQRLEQPECCPKEYYLLMLKCWSHDPNARPKFSEIVSMLPDCKPELVQAVKDSLAESANYSPLFSPSKSKKEFLSYKVGDIITVLDKRGSIGERVSSVITSCSSIGSSSSSLSSAHNTAHDTANGNLWKGALNSGKTGYFNPSDCVAYLGQNLPTSSASTTRPSSSSSTSSSTTSTLTSMVLQSNFIRGILDSKNNSHSSSSPSIYGSRRRLRADMISRPQGDLKHTGHVGADGAFFGDVSFLDGKYHQLPKQIVTPYQENNNHSVKSANEFNKKWSLNSADSKLMAKNGGFHCGDNHEYHEISDEDEFGPLGSMPFETLDFGPSLVEEVFRELDRIKPDLDKEISDAEVAINESSVNVKNEVREINLKINKEVAAITSSKKKQAMVKPISASDQLQLDSAIAMAKDIATRSMLTLDNDRDGGPVTESPKTPTSPNKRKFSFKFSTSKSSPKCERRNFSEETELIGDIIETITPAAKEAYTTLVDKGSAVVSDKLSLESSAQFNNSSDCDEPSDGNPLRMLRSAGIGGVMRAKVRGNRSFSQPRLPTTTQTAGLARVASTRSNLGVPPPVPNGISNATNDDNVNNALPLPPRDRSRPMLVQLKTHQRRHPLVIPSAVNGESQQPTDESPYRRESSPLRTVPVLKHVSCPQPPAAFLTNYSTLKQLNDANYISTKAEINCDSSASKKVAPIPPPKPARTYNDDESLSSEMEAALDNIRISCSSSSPSTSSSVVFSSVANNVSQSQTIPSKVVTDNKASLLSAESRSSSDNRVCNEDMLDLSADKSRRATQTSYSARHRGIESDEVRVMQKVLSKEIDLSSEECADILQTTDWDVHRAIKCIRLREQLRSHNIKVECVWAEMLAKFNWNIRQASNYLIATQGVPEDTTEV